MPRDRSLLHRTDHNRFWPCRTNRLTYPAVYAVKSRHPRHLQAVGAVHHENRALRACVGAKGAGRIFRYYPASGRLNLRLGDLEPLLFFEGQFCQCPGRTRLVAEGAVIIASGSGIVKPDRTKQERGGFDYLRRTFRGAYPAACALPSETARVSRFGRENKAIRTLPGVCGPTYARSESQPPADDGGGDDPSFHQEPSSFDVGRGMRRFGGKGGAHIAHAVAGTGGQAIQAKDAAFPVHKPVLAVDASCRALPFACTASRTGVGAAHSVQAEFGEQTENRSHWADRNAVKTLPPHSQPDNYRDGKRSRQARPKPGGAKHGGCFPGGGEQRPKPGKRIENPEAKRGNS